MHEARNMQQSSSCVPYGLASSGGLREKMRRIQIKKMRGIRRIFTAALICVLFCACMCHAEEIPDVDRDGVPDPVEDTASGIVRVRCFVTDRDENHKSVHSQVGFLIGDGSADYVITAYQNLLFTKEEKEQLITEWSEGLEREVALQEPVYEVIYNGDVHKRAALYEGSSGKDIAILRLDKPMDSSLVLTMAQDDAEMPEELWTCTFPAPGGEGESLYSASTAVFRFGPLVDYKPDEEDAFLLYGMVLDPTTAGSPILNPQGHVIGVHGGLQEEGVSKGCSVRALKKMLDNENLTYRTYEKPQKKKPGKIVFILGGIAAVLLLVVIILLIRALVSRRNSGKDGRNLPGDPRVLRPADRETVQIHAVPFVMGTHEGKVSYYIKGNGRISRMHAAIFYEGGHFYLADVGSRNGTFIRGKQLRPKEKEKLSDGDYFRLADEDFVFRT